MSGLFSLAKRDWVHGAIMTVIGAITTGVIELLQNIITTGHFDFSLRTLSMIALGAVVSGLSYLQKKFFSDNQGKLGGKL